MEDQKNGSSCKREDIDLVCGSVVGESKMPHKSYNFLIIEFL